MQTFEVRRPDGRVLKRVDLRGPGARSFVTLRPALHGLLLDTLGPEALLLGTPVTGLARPSIAAPAVVLEDGRAIEADVVVGADGVGSAVRRALHPAEPPPRPSGYHALRGVSYGTGAQLGTADVAVYLGDGVEIGFARASSTAVYWYISLVDEFAGGPAPATSLDRYVRVLDTNAAAILAATRQEDLRADRLFCREPITAWGRARVTLAGDAAHPVLPHTAQGAALALEDAVALGIVLHGEDIERALRHYERVRARRTRRVVRTGPRIAALTTTRSRTRIAVRNALVRLVPSRTLSLVLTLHARDPHRRLRKSVNPG